MADKNVFRMSMLLGVATASFNRLLRYYVIDDGVRDLKENGQICGETSIAEKHRGVACYALSRYGSGLAATVWIVRPRHVQPLRSILRTNIPSSRTLSHRLQQSYCDVHEHCWHKSSVHYPSICSLGRPRILQISTPGMVLVLLLSAYPFD